MLQNNEMLAKEALFAFMAFPAMAGRGWGAVL